MVLLHCSGIVMSGSSRLHRFAVIAKHLFGPCLRSFCLCFAELLPQIHCASAVVKLCFCCFYKRHLPASAQPLFCCVFKPLSVVLWFRSQYNWWSQIVKGGWWIASIVVGPDLAPNGRGVGYGGQLPGDAVSRPRPETVPLPLDASITLYVEGLPFEIKKREVAHIFYPFVGYREVRLVSKEFKHRGGEPLILCFVDFANPACAATTMSALQELLPGSPLLALDNEDRDVEACETREDFMIDEE
ncbi:hypothetical protein Ahy_A01g002950 [Arachis hypogaea]|uniref:RRM domain-containing protein n=1 Tax=Arachis hypogaea TaxID=3818 RepID=A0A445ESB8_ARAHY|nr:hypothetical protein Ahy_A01g002950 [Arachis hypogaea]